MGISFRRGTNADIRCCSFVPLNLAGETPWLETSTIKQLNITKTPPNPTAPQLNIMRKVTTPRAKNTQRVPSNIRKMLANIASRLTRRANSRNKSRGPMQIGSSSFSRTAAMRSILRAAPNRTIDVYHHDRGSDPHGVKNGCFGSEAPAIVDGSRQRVAFVPLASLCHPFPSPLTVRPFQQRARGLDEYIF